MTMLSPIPVPLDDAELMRVAATPRRRLFPSLNRASAFTPLIVVCCALPALLLLADQSLNEEASLWGLRSLAVANSTTFVQMLEPGLNETGEPLFFQPPLVAWLNGIVVRALGPSHPLSSSFVSLVATGLAIWLTTRLAWRIGGANTALVAALLMCSHPQVLESAIAPTNGPVGFCLVLASVFGLQRHLEGKQPNVSPSLVIAGITWGLSLLAIGPIAFSVPLIFVLLLFNPRSRSQSANENDSTHAGSSEGWPAQRSTLVFVGIGLLIGGWWGVLMLFQYGMAFWSSWWTSLPAECLAQENAEWRCDLRPLLQPTWRDWLTQSALLIGWLIVGLERSWHEWRRPTSERVRRRYQLLLLWWAIAFVGRAIAEIDGTWTMTNTSAWNFALVTPTVLQASLGIGSLIERTVSRRGEFFLIVLIVSLTVWRVSMSSMTGLTCAAMASTLLVCGPMLVPATGRSETGWSESSWRQLLQFTVYGSLVACLSAGLGLRNFASPDANRLADLKTRLATLPEVRRISMISSRDPMPVALRHVLRCRWPRAELVTSEVWDVGLTNAMDAEAAAPRSRFLVLEWTRRDIRLSADTGQAWQVSAVGDPMRFHGRRLSLVLIEPRT